MPSRSLNSSLNKAKGARQDEFYTQLPDIEAELRHYRQHFRGKSVLCNCDDPFESNFFRYFALNFNRLGLKRLVATCYAGSPITGTQLSLFGDETEEERRTPYKAVVTSVRDATGDGPPAWMTWPSCSARGRTSFPSLRATGTSAPPSARRCSTRPT